MFVKAAALIAALLAVGGASAAPNSSLAGCTIIGTSGVDYLDGTAGPDVICGLGGKDIITGGRAVAVDRKSTRLNSSHPQLSRMPSSA